MLVLSFNLADANDYLNEYIINSLCMHRTGSTGIIASSPNASKKPAAGPGYQLAVKGYRLPPAVSSYRRESVSSTLQAAPVMLQGFGFHI